MFINHLWEIYEEIGSFEEMAVYLVNLNLCRAGRDQSRILADEQQLQFFIFMIVDEGVGICSIDYWLSIIEYNTIQIVLIIDYWVDEQQ